MQPIIRFQVENQSITRIDEMHVVSASKNYLQAEFLFLTDEWEGLAKTAVFETEDNVVRHVLLDDDRCEVPWEVLTTPGTLKVSVFAGDRITSEAAEIIVWAAGYKEGIAPKPPTPDLYAQILQRATEAESTAERVWEAADAGLFNGQPGAEGKSAYQLYVENGGQLTEVQWLASLAQGEPTFVNCVEECTNPSKVYLLPDGHLYAYMRGQREVFTDVLSQVGYTKNMRLNSSGRPVAYTGGADVTGYIPCKAGDVIRVVKLNIPSEYAANTYYNSFGAYDAEKNFLGAVTLYRKNTPTPGLNIVVENESVVQFTVAGLERIDETAYIIINGKNIDGNSKVYVNSEFVEGYVWENTGLTYTSADYEDRIVVLENEAKDYKRRLDALESGGGAGAAESVPAYWQPHLEEQAQKIRQAMEEAGANKSAFLWYTDAHWPSNSKVSPAILRYLCRNTPMNKVNFGGDVVGDILLETREQMAYLYEWRKAVWNLPNHHSVIGNHDDFDNATYGNDRFTYAFLLAAEESSDMVKGGEFYYYIDNPCEKTRYFYLDSGKYSMSDEETKFLIDGMTSLPEGWHAVMISHIWFQYTSASAPTMGSVNPSMKKALELFDAYNARKKGSVTMKNAAHAYDFTSCKGKVEFCIGGHIHTDYDLTSAGGIPVILTCCDTNQPRGGESWKTGTITEASVYGIVADYGNGKINVIHVGRGKDREIDLK